jgi:hypothetical protein
MCICTYIYTYIYKYIYKYIYTYICKCTMLDSHHQRHKRGAGGDPTIGRPPCARVPGGVQHTTDTHIHTRTYTYTYTRIHRHIHVHTYLALEPQEVFNAQQTYLHVHIYTCTHIHIYTYTHVHKYTYTHIHTYAHTHIHVHTYTCTHIPCASGSGGVLSLCARCAYARVRVCACVRVYVCAGVRVHAYMHIRIRYTHTCDIQAHADTCIYAYDIGDTHTILILAIRIRY